ncbi:hypothetical protein CC80DRAFT_560649 [Byssothecium circinans]|uniref:Uncharacterized protein n=1 Tax=Byssothecium circinans TaxID=147558 RepID=A0A6A5TX16_9PLEO|nr:hypothetical protein CC80DRAFT_560649 [Byssothecium circinans]
MPDPTKKHDAVPYNTPEPPATPNPSENHQVSAADTAIAASIEPDVPNDQITKTSSPTPSQAGELPATMSEVPANKEKSMSAICDIFAKSISSTRLIVEAQLSFRNRQKK